MLDGPGQDGYNTCHEQTTGNLSMSEADRLTSDPFSDPLEQTVFNTLSSHVAVIDESGTILETNAAWQAFALQNGMDDPIDFRQMNYLAACHGTPGGEAAAKGIKQVIAGEIKEFLLDYPCNSPSRKRWYCMRAVRMEEHLPVRVIISHEEITDVKQAQEALTSSKELLEKNNQELEDANIALKVLLKQREADRINMEKNLLSEVNQSILPPAAALRRSVVSPYQKMQAEILETHLKDILSPMIQNLASAGVILTPQELQVATLVKNGKTTREIADILIISPAAVSFHRANLRTKFGLRSRRSTLRSFLVSIS